MQDEIEKLARASRRRPRRRAALTRSRPRSTRSRKRRRTSTLRWPRRWRKPACTCWPTGRIATKLEYKPGVAQDVAVQIRGNPANAGPVVPRRFLAVLSAEAPKPFTQGSGRLELARAIVTEAAPLVGAGHRQPRLEAAFRRRARRDAQRLRHAGRRGRRIRELLDDLAARFIANGWSLKWLHREIMLSAAYQQAIGMTRRTRAAPSIPTTAGSGA